MKNWISRRNVLSAVSAVTAAGILTACGRWRRFLCRIAERSRRPQ